MMEKDEDLKYALKLASFFSHHVKEKRLKFPAMTEHFGSFGCGLKYKSVPILFFFRNYRGKARNMQFLIFFSL